jgi:hypothetical protein
MASKPELIAVVEHVFGATAQGSAVAGAKIAQDEASLMGVNDDSGMSAGKERVVGECEIRCLAAEHSLVPMEMVHIAPKAFGRVLNQAREPWLLGRSKNHHPMLCSGTHLAFSLRRYLES